MEHSHKFIFQPNGTVKPCSCGMTIEHYQRYVSPVEAYQFYKAEGGKMSYPQFRHHLKVQRELERKKGGF